MQPLNLLAYTGEVLELKSGKYRLNPAGITLNPKLAFCLREHNRARVVGKIIGLQPNGNTLSANVDPYDTSDGRDVAAICEKDNGAMECSVGITPVETVIAPDGVTDVIKGILDEISVCLWGADGGTQTRLAASNSKQLIFTCERNQIMADTNSPNTPATPAAAAAVQAAAPAPAPVQAADPAAQDKPVDPLAQFYTDLADLATAYPDYCPLICKRMSEKASKADIAKEIDATIAAKAEETRKAQEAAMAEQLKAAKLENDQLKAALAAKSKIQGADPLPERIEASGNPSKAVPADVQEYRDWCAANGRKP